jgi:xylulokinase
MRSQLSRPIFVLRRIILLAIAFRLHNEVVSLSSSTSSSLRKSLFVGFDLGTSGARVSIIQRKNNNNNPFFEEVYAESIQWDVDEFGPYDDPEAWMKGVRRLLAGARAEMKNLDAVRSMCVSGTSASCLLIDQTTGQPTRKEPAARMYNYSVNNRGAMERLESYAPPRHTARSSTSSLAKLLAWNEEWAVSNDERLCHQADFVARQFLQCDDDDDVVSDWHNCLKLGYDVRNLTWPDWVLECLRSAKIPQQVLPNKVVSPGEPVGAIRADVAAELGLPPTTVLVGGTTDSNAAFVAATVGGGAANAAAMAGTAVTSLGSTLAIKQLSTTYVEDADKGVYSHRFPAPLLPPDSNNDEAWWLVGGASNVGCAVLRSEHFSNAELEELSKGIDPNKDSPLSYYPLVGKGERFPVADPDKGPVLQPVPESRRDYLHGILQGISDVERDGFLALAALGASPETPSTVWTCGGGSRNDVWNLMRQRRLRSAFRRKGSVNVRKAVNVEASYGAALLAAASFR